MECLRSPMPSSPISMELACSTARWLVLMAAVSASWHSIWNDFVWDDRAAILTNADVLAMRPQDTLGALFRHDFWGATIDAATSHKSYRPITVLSFRWTHAWLGQGPMGYHLGNLVLHAACALLVLELARRLLPTAASVSTKHGCHSVGVGALLAALLFSVHPVHCDAVASVVGRADVLCAMFSLLGGLAYLRAKQHEGDRSRHWRWFVAALGLALMASLSKELGFTVFGLYVLHDVLPSPWLASHSLRHQSHHRHRSSRVLVVVLFTLLLAMLRVRLNGATHQPEWNVLANSIAMQSSRVARCLSYAHLHAWYLWKLVWPSWLSFDYGFDTIPVITQLADPRNLLTMTAYLAVLLGIAVGIRDMHHSPLLQIILLGVVPFVPASNLLFPVGTVVAERLLYLPSVGFCLLVGYLVERALQVVSITRSPWSWPSPRHQQLLPRIMLGSLAVILVAALAQCIQRNLEWRSERTLFRAALRVVPRNIKVLNNVVKVELHDDPTGVLALARISTGMIWAQPDGQLNHALAAAANDDLLVSIRHMRKSLANSAPLDFAAVGYLGGYLFSLWEQDAPSVNSSVSAAQMLRSPTVRLAERWLDRAIALQSFYPVHYYTRALIALRSGHLDHAQILVQAAQRVNEGVRQRGRDLELMVEQCMLLNLDGAIHRLRGEPDEALARFLRALEAYPNDPYLRGNAVAILLEQGRVAEARQVLQRVLATADDATALELARDQLLRLPNETSTAADAKTTLTTTMAVDTDGNAAAMPTALN